jgi:hypothetical protein
MDYVRRSEISVKARCNAAWRKQAYFADKAMASAAGQWGRAHATINGKLRRNQLAMFLKIGFGKISQWGGRESQPPARYRRDVTDGRSSD